MRLQALFFADHIAADANGVISAQGIGTEGFWRQPDSTASIPLWVVATYQLEPNEVGIEHQARIEVVDPDGVVITSQEGPFLVPESPAFPGRRRHQVHWAEIEARLSVEADYSVHVWVDDVHLGDHPFYLREGTRP